MAVAPKPTAPKPEVAKAAEPVKPAPVTASAPKPEAPKIDAPKPAPATLAKAEPAQPATGNSAKSAQDFVMVEPKYETKPAEPEPDAKAVAEAAAKVIKSGSEPRHDLGLLPQPSAALGAPAVNLAAQQQQQMSQPNQLPPANLPPAQHYTGEPISVNLKDVDLKDFFRLIHEISGLNIVLDPAVRGSLTLVLDDVPWDQALDIVLQNNGLDRRPPATPSPRKPKGAVCRPKRRRWPSRRCSTRTSSAMPTPPTSCRL
jgi:type IV pilus assembly protein PilQ